MSKPTDLLIIRALAAQCRLGVTEEERAQPQAIVLDLELAIDASWAASRDDVRSAVDYAKLVEHVREHVEQKPYHLLETVAEEVADLVLREFDTPGVTVEVQKRALPGIEYAAVRVHRRRR